jgi:hypothetical protein
MYCMEIFPETMPPVHKAIIGVSLVSIVVFVYIT